jgi:hypothetical protein
LSPPDAIGIEDQNLSIDLPVYVVIETQPQYGELIGTPPNLIYKPTEHFFGKDTFMNMKAARDYIVAAFPLYYPIQYYKNQTDESHGNSH